MTQRPAKTKLEPKMESVVQIKLPMVRNFSTGGGHLPGDEIREDNMVVKKWQGYPPMNLNVIGKPMPPMPEVSIPRYIGKADYATRIVLPNMLHARFLTSPHSHARITSLDTARAERMPGVVHILTYRNAPPAGEYRGVTEPLSQELNLQGDVVAIVVAETEDLAEDAAEAIEVQYEILPFATTLEQAMAPNAPDLRRGRGNLFVRPERDPHYHPNATWAARRGDIDKGFAEADIVKEFTYRFGGATAVPIQPCGCVAKWDGDRLTFWGMGQSIYPARQILVDGLKIDPSRIRYINRYNGCTFASSRQVSEVYYVYIAHLAKVTGRPVRLMLPKDQEFAQMRIKPETITKFKVGAMKDGRIVALSHEMWVNAGFTEEGSHTSGPGHSWNALQLYTSKVENWKSVYYSYKTNANRSGAVRSYYQQEAKWAWENLIDEMAEAVEMDPIQFRLMHISRPETKLTTERNWAPTSKYDLANETATYDSFPSVELLQEGAKVIGWERRSARAGGMQGRFKKGIGVAMSQHHGGHFPYHDGEAPLAERLKDPDFEAFTAEVALTADGLVTMKNALSDSGTNHDTSLAHMAAEILGFTSRDRIRVIWGDSDLAPRSGEWVAGKTVTNQGAAICSASDKLRRDLLSRAASSLGVDVAKLQMKDGVISATDDPRKRITLAALARANGGSIRHTGAGGQAGGRRGNTRSIGACFAEVEVDTWTGNWRFVRAVYCHDTGLVINPLVAEADMHGSLVECTQMTTDAIPWDREFPGTRHYSVGFLSYRLPTIMDVPEQTQVFIDSLEPRWFFGIKSFSETSIGAVPGAISNAIYNACGVRIREHPITREKIMAGLRVARGTD